LFLSHWFNSLDNPTGVFTYRHYASCLHSLQKRHASELLVNPDPANTTVRLWSDPDVALESWLVHNNSILATAQQYSNECVVISQQAIINGAPLIEIVNDALSVSLNTHCDIGVDARKTTIRKELPLIKTSLQDELEHTWDRLQQIAVTPADYTPTVQWIEPQRVNPQQQPTPPSLISQWDRLGVAQSHSA